MNCHLSVKAFGIGIRHDFNFRHVSASCVLHGVDEQLFSYARANVFRRHPQVVQLRFILPNYQCVETENLIIFFGNEDLISGDKVFGDREIFLPVLDPVFRITPMTFCIMGDLRQSDSLASYCWSYPQIYFSVRSGPLPNCAIRVFDADHDDLSVKPLPLIFVQCIDADGWSWRLSRHCVQFFISTRSDLLVAGKLQTSGLTLSSTVEENVVPVYYLDGFLTRISY